MPLKPLVCTCFVAAAVLSGCAFPTATPPRPPFAGADDVEFRELAPGVVHATIVDAAGPWTIHVVTVETARCRPRLAAGRPAGRLSARAPTSALAGTSIIAVNADFFRLPGGTPVGAYVSGGVPHAGPTEWPVFAVTADGRWGYGRARLEGAARVAQDSVAITQINREATSFTAYQGTTTGVALHTARADTLPADSTAWRIVLRHIAGDEAAGAGIVLRADSPAVASFANAGEAVLLARGEATSWARRRVQGDTVHWHARVVVDDGTGADLVAVEAVGGFPALLVGGRDVVGLQTVRRAFGDARHPRTALGWTADRSRLFFVVVDGRQEHSDGMSLPELVALFRRLGAAEAINLDGGGSTALVTRGRLVNRPSDEAGERSVGNILALTSCG